MMKEVISLFLERKIDLFQQFEFTADGVKLCYAMVKKMLKWVDVGWEISCFQDIDLTESALDAFQIGSPLFLKLWQKNKRNDLQRLQIMLKMLDFPEELSGNTMEIHQLLERFDDDLSPEHAFWWSLADCVAHVFTGDKLSENTVLARKIHQLRYVISSQQAQYIRQKFKNECCTDREAFIFYLRQIKDQKQVTFESARFHNKLNRHNPSSPFPEGFPLINIKVLINFHTEFILDSKGKFVNELDAEGLSCNGVINGASFNYGKRGKQHWELDVYPVKQHDPAFRKEMMTDYLSANLTRASLFKKVSENFKYSYFNGKGYYAQNHQSMERCVQKEQKSFKKRIKK